MRIKYNEERFFNVDNLNKLKKLFGIFNVCKDNEDIVIKDIFYGSKFDTLSIYKIIYHFYRFVNKYDKNIKYDYYEVMEIIDYLCPGDDVLIWIYEKYGHYIENDDENNIYYVTYMEYLRDKKNKKNEKIMKISLEHLNSNSINFLCKNVDDIINNRNYTNIIKNKFVDIYFKRIEKQKLENIIFKKKRVNH